MIALRCTQRMLRRLKGVEIVAAPTPPTAVLGDWYVNLLHLGRDQVVMATSELSLLTVLAPARDLRKSLTDNLAESTWHLLVAIGIAPDRAATETEEMRSAVFARTASRSVLASMNNLGQTLEWIWQDRLSPLEIMLRLADTPMRAIPDGKFNFGIPHEVARKLLDGHRE